MKLWQVDTGKELRTCTGHEDRVFSVAFSPDGKILASGSGDRTIMLTPVGDITADALKPTQLPIRRNTND